MVYYCDVCDKTIKLKSKINRLKSLTSNQYEESFRIKNTFKNPIFFDVDELFTV